MKIKCIHCVSFKKKCIPVFERLILEKKERFLSNLNFSVELLSFQFFGSNLKI